AVELNGGQAGFGGAVTGGLSSPRLTGHVFVDQFNVQGRQFDSLAADIAAAETRVSVQNGSLNRGSMQARFAGSVGLVNWSPKPTAPLSATATVRNADLADVMVLAGKPAEGYSGAVSADANVSGTASNPHGSANLLIANGTIAGEPF